MFVFCSVRWIITFNSVCVSCHTYFLRLVSKSYTLTMRRSLHMSYMPAAQSRVCTQQHLTTWPSIYATVVNRDAEKPTSTKLRCTRRDIVGCTVIVRSRYYIGIKSLSPVNNPFFSNFRISIIPGFSNPRFSPPTVLDENGCFCCFFSVSCCTWRRSSRFDDFSEQGMSIFIPYRWLVKRNYSEVRKKTATINRV